VTDTDASHRTAITDEFARQWIPRFLDGWRSHDPEQLLKLSTEDVRWEDPFIPSHGELRGRDALRDWLEYVWRAFPDMEFEMVGEPMISLDRTRLSIEWVGQARMTGALDPPGFAPSGTVINMRGVDIHAFRDDLLAHVVTVTDVAAVALQIGAMPPPGSIGEKLGVQVQHLMARRLRPKS
jgi:steroid delta-isomerase-like uncharacterized protein